MVFSAETVSNQVRPGTPRRGAPPMIDAPRRPAGRFRVFRSFRVSAALMVLALPIARGGEPERTDANEPVHFANDIVPIFTKLGCNSGACHGKADGQNGFKLSLFGFEPA